MWLCFIDPCVCSAVVLIFLGDENKTSLMCLGAIEPLCRLISHEDKTVRRNAVMALGVMASNST